MLQLDLKIRVSMVRFRPTPPIWKARYVTVTGLYLWGIGPMGGAGSGGVRWGLAGFEKVQLEKPFTSPGLHQIIRRNAQKILQTL